jgi:hypothetical protein
VLTGAAEAPGPGDPDGSGTADLRVNPGAARICVDLAVQGIEPATAAHIHRAPGPACAAADAPAAAHGGRPVAHRPPGRGCDGRLLEHPRPVRCRSSRSSTSPAVSRRSWTTCAWTSQAAFARIVEQFSAIGILAFVLFWPGEDPRAGLERLAADVLDRVR